VPDDWKNTALILADCLNRLMTQNMAKPGFSFRMTDEEWLTLRKTEMIRHLEAKKEAK